MPRNPTTGVYEAPENSWNPAVAGTVIDPEDWNAQLADYEAAFTDSLSRTGEGSATLIGISGSSTQQNQNLNSSVYLDFVNTYVGAQHVGGEIRFGAESGDPYVVVKSDLISGPSPYYGDLSFYTRRAGGSLTRSLKIDYAGRTHSGPDHAEVGGSYSFGAVNLTGYQNFIGYTESSGITQNTPGQYVGATAAFYGVAQNNYTGLSNVAAWGAYIEGRGESPLFAAAIEASVQTIDPAGGRIITPNSMSGTTTDKPLTPAVWASVIGTVQPGGMYDSSVAFAAVGGTNTGSFPGKFIKGLVFGNDTIATVGGHMEAINLGLDHEIVWYGATNSDTGRLYSDSSTLTWSGPALFAGSFTPTSTTIPATFGIYKDGGTDQIGFGFSGSRSLTITNLGLLANSTSGAMISNAAASSTAPTLIPNRSSATTGFGAQASGNISMIVAGAEVGRIISTGIQGSAFHPTGTTIPAAAGIYQPAANQVGVGISGARIGIFTSSGLVMDNAASPLITASAASSTAPSIIPNRSQLQTGIGAQAAGNVSVIISAAEKIRVDGTATAGQTALMLYDVDNATLERVTVGAADSGGVGFKVLRIPN